MSRSPKKRNWGAYPPFKPKSQQQVDDEAEEKRLDADMEKAIAPMLTPEEKDERRMRKLRPRPWRVQKVGPNKGKLFVPMPNAEGGGMWLFPDEARQQSEGGAIPPPPADFKTPEEIKYPYLRKGD